MSKAAGPSTSSNLLNSILDFAQMPFAASWIHTSARQSSQIPSLRHALLSPPPARLSPAAGRFAIPRTFATTAVAPKGGIRPGSERSGWARYFLLVPPMIAACLGKWQLDRRQWKTDLLERRQRIMKVRIFEQEIIFDIIFGALIDLNFLTIIKKQFLPFHVYRVNRSTYSATPCQIPKNTSAFAQLVNLTTLVHNTLGLDPGPAWAQPKSAF